MMTDERLTRRRMIQATTGLAVTGVAGCTGGSSGQGSTSSEQHDEGGESSHTEEGGHSEEGGHHEEGGHSEAVGEPSDTADVEMVTQDGSYHFAPHVVRVNVGGTVTFHNKSGTHTSTAYHPDNDQPRLVPKGATAWDSGLLSEQGATFEHTFETEGVYHYYCQPHESMGMLGSVIVGEPDPHEQVALEEPPASKPEAVREKLKELNGMVRSALGDSHE